jgi:hypothetical protein
MRDRERERERGGGSELVPMQKKPTAVAGKSPRQRAEYTVGLEGGK